MSRLQPSTVQIFGHARNDSLLASYTINTITRKLYSRQVLNFQVFSQNLCIFNLIVVYLRKIITLLIISTLRQTSVVTYFIKKEYYYSSTCSALLKLLLWHVGLLVLLLHKYYPCRVKIRVRSITGTIHITHIIMQHFIE